MASKVLHFQMNFWIIQEIGILTLPREIPRKYPPYICKPRLGYCITIGLYHPHHYITCYSDPLQESVDIAIILSSSSICTMSPCVAPIFGQRESTMCVDPMPPSKSSKSSQVNVSTSRSSRFFSSFGSVPWRRDWSA